MAENDRVVLIGTYKKGQLAKWRGWYNYPISDKDKISERDFAKINELWLFNGTKNQRTYKAGFVGVKSRDELIKDYKYPASGKAHGSKYLLFETKPIYRHKGDAPEDAERVIIRTADFATSPKVRKQLKAYLESPDRNDPDLAKQLPSIISKIPSQKLRVCEAAVQLDFFDEIVPQVTKLVKRNSAGRRKFALATVFSGIGAIEQALLRKHIDHEIVFACDNGEQTPFQCKAVEWKECEDEFYRLSKFVDTIQPTTESQQSAAEIVKAQRDSIERLLDGAPATSKRPERELKDRVHMLYEAVGFYKFRVTWENEPDWKARKHLVDMLYRPLLNRNNVRKSYVANYDVDDDRFHWNVSFLEGSPYRNKVDLLVGGSPCQSFSLVGKQMGLSDTRGTLFYEYARLVSEIRPKCFIYENVRALLSNDNGRTWATISRVFTDLGYDWKYAVLNAKDYGMPQNRERVFVVGFRKDLKVGDSFQFPKPVELTRTMQDFLLDVVPGKYYLPEKGVEFVLDEGNLTKRYTQIDGTVQLCQKKKEAAMRCLYFENGICCESDCVGVDDLEVYFRDSFRYHVGKSASEKSVRQYLSHQPVIVHDRALIHYWECA